MSSESYRALTDLAEAAARSESALDSFGVTLAQIEVFVESWGRGVSSRTSPAHRPVAGVVLLHASKTASPPRDVEIAQRVADVRSAQAQFEVLHVSLDGEFLDRERLPPQERQKYPGGKWTHQQASALSLVSEGVVAWVSGFEFKLFVKGALVVSYTDVQNMRVEHAAELIRKMPMNEEFFEALAQKLLQHSTETGIWHAADHRVLVPKPEAHMEERTVWFMKAHLSGFTEYQKQCVDESNGRVDLLITYSDGIVQVVEIKWLGRALKTAHLATDPKKIEAAIKSRWDCDCVTVMEPGTVLAGVVQLGIYLQNTAYDLGCLVVFDCSRDLADIHIEDKQLAAANISRTQFLLADVKLDPRPPSKIGRASLRKSK